MSDPLSTNIVPPGTLVGVTEEIVLPFGVYQTPNLGSDKFPKFPIFETTIPIEAAKRYVAIIKAVDATGREAKQFSNIEQFIAGGLTNPPTGPEVAWPPRPLPAVSKGGFTDLLARQLILPNGFRGVGIRIGEFELDDLVCDFLYLVPFNPGYKDNPADYVYVETNGVSNKPILPFAIYRYQVPNALYPDVSEDVTQVSPLIEDIAYRFHLDAMLGEVFLIEDPFIAALPVVPGPQISPCWGTIPQINVNTEDCSQPLTITQDPPAGTLVGPGVYEICVTVTDPFANTTKVTTEFELSGPAAGGQTSYELYALDTQPVVIGASYRYVLLRFDETGHEIDRVIPVGEIEVKAAP